MEGPLRINNHKNNKSSLDNSNNIINNNSTDNNLNNNNSINNNQINNNNNSNNSNSNNSGKNDNSSTKENKINASSTEEDEDDIHSKRNQNTTGGGIYTMDTSLTLDSHHKKRKNIENEEEEAIPYHPHKRASFSINISPTQLQNDPNLNIFNVQNSNNNNLTTIPTQISTPIITTTTTTSSSSTDSNIHSPIQPVQQQNQQENQQQPQEEIEEINRERQERDKMLHEEVDIDQYNNYNNYKYGDGEEGENYETLLTHNLRSIHSDEITNNESPRSPLNKMLDEEHNQDSNNENHTDGEPEQHKEEDDEDKHNNGQDSDYHEHQSTDDDHMKSDGEKEPESARNSGEQLKGHHDGNKDESTVSTPQHAFNNNDDDEDDDEEYDVPLRIQQVANNKLPKLSLSNCWLKVIPTDVWSLLEIRDLDLSANQLKKVSKSIGQLVHLKRLRLNHNQLTALPKELYSLPRLTTLYLNNNNFKVVPKEINRLTSLKTLDLSFNQITDISPQANINLMTNLVELRLRYNQLSTLPTNMLEATHLQVLWLEGNRLPLNKAILKKSPLEILSFLRDYKPKEAPNKKGHPVKANITSSSLPPIDTASTIAVAQAFAQKEMDIKKRKKENLDDIKKQHIEAELKLKQLEEELLIANAKATKFEEEASFLQQHFNNPTAPQGNNTATATHLNLPQILLNQPHLAQGWDHHQHLQNNNNSSPNISTPPASTSPVLTGQQVVTGISQISLLSPTHNNPPSPISVFNPQQQQTNQPPLPTQTLQQQQQQNGSLSPPKQQPQLDNSASSIPIVQINQNQNHLKDNFPIPTAPTKVIEAEKPFEWEVPLSEIVVGARIGRGGYGQVFRGSWRGTEVAVKMLFNDNVNAKLISDLRKEVDLLCKLRHPNIVLFMGACTEPASPCIVTEYLSRGSLANILLDENIEMDWGLRLQLGFDCARGMTYLHSRNPIIIHRDLKTDNLLVDDSWQVKVADFGLATVKSHTFAKTMCGTTGWVAPEVLAEEGYTEKADVYSYAIVLWELLTRLIPYAGKNTMQVVRSIDRGERLPMPSWCPTKYAALINRCWDTDPQNRPSFPEILPIMEEMISEFQSEKREAIATGKPIPYVGPPEKNPSLLQQQLQQQQNKQLEQQLFFQQQQAQQQQAQLQQLQQQLEQQQKIQQQLQQQIVNPNNNPNNFYFQQQLQQQQHFQQQLQQHQQNILQQQQQQQQYAYPIYQPLINNNNNSLSPTTTTTVTTPIISTIPPPLNNEDKMKISDKNLKQNLNSSTNNNNISSSKTTPNQDNSGNNKNVFYKSSIP